MKANITLGYTQIPTSASIVVTKDDAYVYRNMCREYLKASARSASPFSGAEMVKSLLEKLTELGR